MTHTETQQDAIFVEIQRVSGCEKNYGSVGWMSELPQVCRLFDDGDVRANTGELPNSSDGDLGRELKS